MKQLGMVQFLRLFSIFPAWQAALIRMIAGVHRSMKILGATMHRRGLAYAMLLTAIVTFVGAAGMYAFGRTNGAGIGIHSYGDAVWWTAMTMTTLGSDYFPHTSAGRVLCFILAVFAFSVFGYVTASISSYFINTDAADKRSDVPSAAQLRQILDEVRVLRAEIEHKRTSSTPNWPGGTTGREAASSPPPNAA